MEIDLNVLMLITLFGMLLAIFAGVHIALALGATAMIGTYFIFEDAYMAASQVGGAAYELIRDHVFMTYHYLFLWVIFYLEVVPQQIYII